MAASPLGPLQTFQSAALAATGIACSQLMPPARADVRAIREALGLSAAAFAERFGLEAPIVEGWEQGQPIDAAANVLLTVIARDPDAVARLLETPLARR
jgi:DNA-binding transcriptional regulator YiaG